MNNNEKNLLNHLSYKINLLRKELGFSQEKLVEKCDFDRTYISLLEIAKCNPSYLNLKKSCNGLAIELSDLLKES